MQFIDINNKNNNKTLTITTIEEEEQFFKKKNNCGIIYFYEPEHLFGFLSNFYPSPFIASTTATSSTTDNNFNNNNNNTSTTTEIIEWKTSEHFYQAHKFTQNKEIFNEIQTSSTPKEAFELSRKYQFKIDNNNNNNNNNNNEWNDERKEKIMMEALINKFLYSKNKELLNRLIQLKGFYLIENSFVDSYWGIGSDGKGKNRLGILLMKLIENVVNK